MNVENSWKFESKTVVDTQEQQIWFGALDQFGSRDLLDQLLEAFDHITSICVNYLYFPAKIWSRQRTG